MYNFEYHNPVKLIFGKGTIANLSQEISKDKNVLVLYGGGSIKKNGVYEQVMQALDGYSVLEFSGIEPNPQFSTLMQAVKLVQDENIDFLLSVGGGSVLDGTKFIAAAACFEGDPWDILAKGPVLQKAIPLGCVLTLPATGSEMNFNSVVSRKETGEKLAFADPVVYPVFSILDPETTFTLPERQTANGIVDAFVHVMEQYMTYDVNAALQDRYAEAILQTLIEQAPIVMQNPQDYDARANVMFAATMALNKLIAVGVPQDWATHMIGHELTALHNIDHARTLAIVLPALLKHHKTQKHSKLIKFARNVWNITDADENVAIDKAIAKMDEFFRSLGMPTRLSHLNLTIKDVEKAPTAIGNRGWTLGERQDIKAEQVLEILTLAA